MSKKDLLDLPLELIREILADAAFTKTELKALRLVHTTFRDAIDFKHSEKLFDAVSLTYYERDGGPGVEAINELINSPSFQPFRYHAKKITIGLDHTFPFCRVPDNGTLAAVVRDDATFSSFVHDSAELLVKSATDPLQFPKFTDVYIRISTEHDNWDDHERLALYTLYGLLRPPRLTPPSQQVHAEIHIWGGYPKDSMGGGYLKDQAVVPFALQALRPGGGYYRNHAWSLISCLPPLQSLVLTASFQHRQLLAAVAFVINHSPDLRSLTLTTTKDHGSEYIEEDFHYDILALGIRSRDALCRLERVSADPSQMFFNLQTQWPRLRALKDAGKVSEIFQWDSARENEVKLEVIHSTALSVSLVRYLQNLAINHLRSLKLHFQMPAKIAGQDMPTEYTDAKGMATSVWTVLSRFQHSLTHLEVRPHFHHEAPERCSLSQLPYYLLWSPLCSQHFYRADLRFSKMQAMVVVTPRPEDYDALSAVPVQLKSQFSDDLGIFEVDSLMNSISPSLRSLQYLRVIRSVAAELDDGTVSSKTWKTTRNGNKDPKQYPLRRLEQDIGLYVFPEKTPELGRNDNSKPRLVLGDCGNVGEPGGDSYLKSSTRLYILEGQKWQVRA